MNKLIILLLPLSLIACGQAPKKFGEGFGAGWQPGGVEASWSTTIGNVSEDFALSMVNNQICVANERGQVMFIVPSTGAPTRQQELGLPLSVAGSCTQDYLAGISDDLFVRGFALSDGSSHWQTKLSATLLRPPLLVGTDTLLLFQSNGELLAVSLATGYKLWSLDLETSPFRLKGNFTPVANEQLVFFGMPEGTLYAVDYVNGVSTFSLPLADPNIGGIAAGINNVGGVALSDELLCASAFTGETTCIQTSNGQIAWQAPQSSGGSLAMGEDSVFFIDGQGSLVALDLANGELRWEVEQASALRTAKVLYSNNLVVVENGFGGISLHDPASGEVVGGFALSGQLITLQELAGDILVLTTQGQLQRLTIN